MRIPNLLNPNAPKAAARGGTSGFMDRVARAVSQYTYLCVPAFTWTCDMSSVADQICFQIKVRIKYAQNSWMCSRSFHFIKHRW